jgi:Xaa-Pro aminopeptidase
VSSGQLDSNHRLWLSYQTSYAIASVLEESYTRTSNSPVSYMKAVKNEVEIAAMRRAHLKDSAAFVCFFDWLERQLSSGQAVDECSAAAKIEEIRRSFPDFVELSYPTIAGSGPNGAIIHYEPTPPTCAAVTTEQMFLVDSGGQWLDGTTDTTRTVHLGNASLFERHTFTRVLQGAVEQMQQHWPFPSTPSDFLARQPLLRDGLSYGHGTSHGVGEMLFVHEDINGPWVGGVVTSVEPGFYHIASNDSARNALYPGYDRGFGGRIETDCLVVRLPTPLSDREFWTFEPLAFVPIQASLMRTSIMTDLQIQWLNEYHKQCREKVGPWLQDRDSAMQWLVRNTQPIVKRKDD